MKAFQAGYRAGYMCKSAGLMFSTEGMDDSQKKKLMWANVFDPDGIVTTGMAHHYMNANAANAKKKKPAGKGKAEKKEKEASFSDQNFAEPQVGTSATRQPEPVRSPVADNVSALHNMIVMHKQKENPQ